ncbi:MAG: DNA (cytosine-5-)-methyltransferase [Candidatus Hydrogenedentota bacterium]|nr:MAG: DNA (cytosine-5-)-methyltransferase [Candidatus Hydrogenedentota bacterium]
MKLDVVDLFSGAGGMSRGFSNAGFDILGAFENWGPAIELYGKNFDHPVFASDLSDVESVTKKIITLSPNIIIGGPPCQDFSSAGKRDENLGRATLTIHYAEIIRQIRPEYFVMENVQRARNSTSVSIAKDILRKSGYGITQVVLNACLCGVPQKRNRYFMIGELNGMDNVLEERLIDNLSNNPITLREYFDDELDFEHYYRHPRSYKRRAVFSIDEPSPTIRGVNRPVPDGYPGHPGDTAPISKKIRVLTTRERAQIQTFPDDFLLEGTKTNLEQMIGNAVPVKLAEYVATQLQNHIISKGQVRAKEKYAV